jgi:hypothetical protein
VVRTYAPDATRKALDLLGELPPEDGVPVLVQHLTMGGGADYRGYMEWNAAAYLKAHPEATAEAARSAARDNWFGQFRALAVIIKMGPPAVPALVQSLAEAGAQPPANQPEQPWDKGSHEAKVILLCKALDQILGTDAAVARLRDAAAAEKDPARAQRLTAAADRIAKGLLLTAD